MIYSTLLGLVFACFAEITMCFMFRNTRSADPNEITCTYIYLNSGIRHYTSVREDAFGCRWLLIQKISILNNHDCR